MSRIVLNWSQNSDFDSFDIFRSTSTIDINNLPLPIATGVLETRYSDSNVVLGTTYFYRIRTNYAGLSVISDEFALKAEPVASPSPFTHDKIKIYMSTNAPTTSAGWQKIQLNSVSYDTNALFDSTNKYIKPKKAGYYMCNARARFINTVSGIALGLGKNGANFAAIGPDTAANGVYAIGGSILVYCNGTTDYIDLQLYASSVLDFTVGTFDTYLEVIGPF